MIEENKLNKYEKVYKNNLLTLNLFSIFLSFLFLSTFLLYFLSLIFFFLKTEHNLKEKLSTFFKSIYIRFKLFIFRKTNYPLFMILLTIARKD